MRSKLEEWLHFDIVSMYPEYQGALSFIASNPLFRSIKKSYLEPPNSGFDESVAYKVVTRSGQSVDGLRLEVINERPRGRMKPFVAEFGTDAIAVFDSKAEIDKEGRSITHPEHGLLSWCEPVPLLRTIHVNMAVTSRRKTVHVPPLGRKRSEEVYEPAYTKRGEPKRSRRRTAALGKASEPLAGSVRPDRAATGRVGMAMRMMRNGAPAAATVRQGWCSTTHMVARYIGNESADDVLRFYRAGNLTRF